MKARKLCSVSRFINDLNAINDAGTFESNFRVIYLEELKLYRENGNNTKVIFLDLDIKIINRKFQIGLFDKRDSFHFGITINVISKGAKKCKIANVLLKFFKKHQSDFNYITNTGKELLAIIRF